MQTTTLNRYSLDVDNTLWRKLLWLAVVTMTMGLCLLTPKRLLTEELRKELLATQPEVALASEVHQSSSATEK